MHLSTLSFPLIYRSRYSCPLSSSFHFSFASASPHTSFSPCPHLPLTIPPQHLNTPLSISRSFPNNNIQHTSHHIMYPDPNDSSIVPIALRPLHLTTSENSRCHPLPQYQPQPQYPTPRSSPIELVIYTPATPTTTTDKLDRESSSKGKRRKERDGRRGKVGVPNEFWICCCSYVPGRVLSCGTMNTPDVSSCAKCEHEKCTGCTEWRRQV